MTQAVFSAPLAIPSHPLCLKQPIETADIPNSVTSNSVVLSPQSKLYKTSFSPHNWTGKLTSSSIDPTSGGIRLNAWEAGNLLTNDIETYSHNSRKIVIMDQQDNGSSQAIPFLFNNLSKSKQSILETSAESYHLAANDLVAYLRGSSSHEHIFRKRTSKLGDITSTPIYLGPPNFPYPNQWMDKINAIDGAENNYSYARFIHDNINRPGVIYVGANDGMLHAFNADTGKELAAFIPDNVFNHLAKLASPNYNNEHHYYVNGSPNIIDAYSSSDNQWHSILATGLNEGGKSILVIDVTTPPGYTKSCGQLPCTFTEIDQNESDIADKVLWEFSDADLGYTFSKPNIIRLHNGEWAVVFGNGYNSTSDSGDAFLYIIQLDDTDGNGLYDVLAKISTEVGKSEDPTETNRPNGLNTVTPIDIDNDSITDYIFAGDLFGNVWKFDVTSSSTDLWKLDYKVFTALSDSQLESSAQPITSRIQVIRHLKNRNSLLLLFGTGKYLEGNGIDNSNSNQLTQSIYGIWDKQNNAIPSFSKNDLQEQKIIKEIQIETQLSNSDTIKNHLFRLTTNHKPQWHGDESSDSTSTNTHFGWFMDLCLKDINDSCSANNKGERIIADPIVRSGKVIFNTFIHSDDECLSDNISWSFELDAQTGSSIPFSIYDINNDKEFSISDSFSYNPNNINSVKNLYASGHQSKVHKTHTPLILSQASQNLDFKYQNLSSGIIETSLINPGVNATGRQSWQEIK